jgi:hypothetical protein
MSTPILCCDIQRWLYTDRRASCAVMLPNYTPRGWHECDVFGVTRAGYFYEFAIKISVSDFRADAAKKDSDRYVYNGNGYERTGGRRKHDRLAMGDESGPSRFFYVVPDGLIGVEAVPSWAGLLYVKQRERNSNWGSIAEGLPAPKLHGKKIARVILRHAMNVCYYRYWDTRLELAKVRVAQEMEGAA